MKRVPERLGDPPKVALFVSSDDEDDGHDYTLAAGDTFPLGDQTWKVTEIKNPSSRLWHAIITRVE